MSAYLQFFILLPLVAFALSLLIPRNKEKIISFVAVGSTALHLTGGIALIIYWLIIGSPVLDIKHIVLYHTDDFEFFIDFYFDAASAVYLFTGSSVLLLVSIFSKYYLHRDEGFKRFFSTLLLFFLGYNFVIFSGNFETLFIGWEILGFCSFLLIAFYRDRYLPVKNALKVISVYRLGDVCLMLAMWMCHHLFHQNITFLQLTNGEFISGLYAGHENMFLFIAIMIVIAPQQNPRCCRSLPGCHVPWKVLPLPAPFSTVPFPCTWVLFY
ncbi:MAG: proton-conducting transporter membrane subunit [Ferruginibacter sp.]